jgi:hypothetical protein
LEVLFERVAGLDVGKASVTVCVRTPGPNRRRVSEVPTFSTMSRSLAVHGSVSLLVLVVLQWRGEGGEAPPRRVAGP